MRYVCRLVIFSMIGGVAAQDAREGERKAYDEIYSSKREMFSSAPNAFMVRTLTGRQPGRALKTRDCRIVIASAQSFKGAG